MSVPLRVAATITSPVVEATRHPIMLDSLLTFARAMDGDLDPLRLDTEPDIPLPLDRWEDGDQWGWKASQARYEVAGYTSAQVRRKPNTEAMAIYGTFAKHHLALGPHKARDTLAEAAWIHRMEWDVIATSPDALMELLLRIGGVGKHVAIGYGHVSRWEVTPSSNDEGWRDRGWKSGNRHRPPYWHPLGRVA